MKKTIFSLLLAATSMLGLLNAQNPVAEFYNGPEGYPVWVNEIQWNNRITMVNQGSGAANFAEFKAKRDLLYAQGGGVLYYPAGTYVFDIPDGPNDEGLMLKKGIVILGETPTSDKAAVKGKNTNAGSVDIDQRGLSSLPTKFKFTRRQSFFGAATDSIPKMWNCIGHKVGANETHLGQNSHMGVAWIEMEFGYMYFGMDSQMPDGSNGWAGTWATSTAYTGGADKQLHGWGSRVPNGTHFMDPFSGIASWGGVKALTASKIFVFGVKMSNSTPPNYVLDRTKKYAQGWRQENGGWRFGARIGNDAKDVFVANNVIDFPTACFSYQAPTSVYHTGTSGYNAANNKWLIYDYGNAIGIDVNKSLLTGFNNRALVNEMEGFYKPNVIIRDNWVYNHGNKGIEVAGTWVVVQNNVNYRHHLGLSDGYPYLATDNNKQKHYAMDGWSYSTAETASDLMARFIDYGGRNVWFDDNAWCGTGSRGNDGEGILAQRHNGIEVYSVAITNNKQADLNQGEPGYIGPWDTWVVGLFQGWNKVMGNVGANVCGAKPNYAEDISHIENFKLDGVTPSGLYCGPTTVNKTVMDAPQDWQDACPTVDPTAPTITTMNYNATTGAVEIAWTDVDNETAYRVDRRKVGESNWYTVAYRPRNETKTSLQPTLSKALSGAANYGPGTLDSRSFPLIIQDLNKTEWHDYTAVNGSYEYRVAAIKCIKDEATFASQSITTLLFSPSALVVPLNVYPNPVKSTATIKFSSPNGAKVNLTLLDLNGKILKHIGRNVSNEATFDASDLNAGMYFIRLDDTKGNTSTTKVLIEK